MPDRFRNRGHRRKATTFVFRLTRDALIQLVIRQVSPDCRLEGILTVRGDRGTNRVRWRGGIAGELLRPGTYTVSVRSGRNESRPPAARETIVIVPPNGSPARARPAPSTCPGKPETVGGASTLSVADQHGQKAPSVVAESGVLGTEERAAPRSAQGDAAPPGESAAGDWAPVPPTDADSGSLVASIVVLVAAWLAAAISSIYMAGDWRLFRRRH